MKGFWREEERLPRTLEGFFLHVNSKGAELIKLPARCFRDVDHAVPLVADGFDRFGQLYHARIPRDGRLCRIHFRGLWLNARNNQNFSDDAEGLILASGDKLWLVSLPQREVS